MNKETLETLLGMIKGLKLCPTCTCPICNEGIKQMIDLAEKELEKDE